jgi:GNAT superfamily N-acetyltransferase
MIEINIKQYSKLNEMLEFAKLFKELYPKMKMADLKERLDEMIEKYEYKLVVAFTCDKKPKAVGLAGYHIGSMLYCGRFVQLGNLIVTDKRRNFGIAVKIMDYIKKQGELANCVKLVLDSYTTNFKAHKVYLREGMQLKAFHFMENLRNK